MIANRELSPEEKEKHRQWQMDEILRRRGRPGHPFVEPGAEAEPEPDPDPGAIEYKCPKCGTPFRNPKYRRCYGCHPARRVTLDEAFARPKGPVYVPAAEAVATVEVGNEPAATDHIADVGNMVEMVGNGKFAPDASDHLRVDPKMIEAGGDGKPDPIDALRRVVDALDGLDVATARWVLQSAARLPRAGADTRERE
jgi:hypothetical protein